MKDNNWHKSRLEFYLQNNYPKIIFSFSSKSLVNISETLNKYMSHLTKDSVLLSLYDINYAYKNEEISNIFKNFDGNLFLDSGKFEASGIHDISESYFYDYKSQSWDYELYKNSITNFKQIYDKYNLVNFDINTGILDQIKNGSKNFSEKNIKGKKIHLTHPYDKFWNENQLKTLLDLLIKIGSFFDVLGFTEKELGRNIIEKIKNLLYIRKYLSSNSTEYVPIHIFGCGDPKTIILLFFAGGDIFDGLGWLRFYFKQNSTYYKNEFEIDSFYGSVHNTDIILHNIQYLRNLESNLSFSLIINDYSQFKTEIDFVDKIEVL